MLAFPEKSRMVIKRIKNKKCFHTDGLYENKDRENGFRGLLTNRFQFWNRTLFIGDLLCLVVIVVHGAVVPGGVAVHGAVVPGGVAVRGAAIPGVVVVRGVVVPGAVVVQAV